MNTSFEKAKKHLLLLRQKILLRDLSRTSLNTKEMLLVKHLFPLVRRNKFSELTERKPLT